MSARVLQSGGGSGCCSAVAPRCSVVMPVYNTKEEFFREAIESVLQQTYKDFELIIVDDCSDAFVRAVVESYQDPRIRYYRMESQSGAAAARNLALDVSQGEFIAFLDSDDVAKPDRFEKQLAFFAGNPQVGCLGTAVNAIGDDANKVVSFVYDSHEEIERKLIFFGCVLCQSSVMLRKKLLDEHQIRYKNEYVPAEDYGFWIDLIGHTKFAILPDELTCYRSHLENITHRMHDQQNEKAGQIQVDALENCCRLKIDNKDSLRKFFGVQPLSHYELGVLQELLPRLIHALVGMGYSETEIFYCYRKKLKKIFYKTRTIEGQCDLFASKLNQYFRLPLVWRLFCFVTRSLFLGSVKGMKESSYLSF